MRIGLVVYGSLETLTGGYLYDRIVAEELVRRGHQVELISLAPGPYLSQVVRGWFTPGIAARGEADRLDIVLQDELCHPVLIGMNRRGRSRRRPPAIALVHHLRSAEPRGRALNVCYGAVEKRYLAGVDGFIFNSEATQRSVETLVGPGRPAVVARPSGSRFGFPLTAADIGERCRTSGPLELVFVGGVIARKGLLPLVESLSRADRRRWRLAVAGSLDSEPAYAARVRHRIDALHLSECVRFYGQLDEDRLVELLRRSHLFCMPYAFEGFGIAMLEAMAFGLPALGSTTGAAGETIVDGRNGYLFGPGDGVGPAALITALHEDRDRLGALSAGALKTATEMPDWAATAAAVERFLGSLQPAWERRSGYSDD